MKERLIAFTRNEANKTKVKKIAIVTWFIQVLLVQFGIIAKVNIILPLIAGMLIIFGCYYIIKLFDLDEKIIRCNKMTTIIMAYTSIVGDLLLLFFAVIVLIQVPTLNILGIIMVIIAICICNFVSKRVNEQYREKIITE